MNPLTNVRNITRLNDNDLKNNIFDHNLTWHSQYKDSAYIFVGGLPFDLTEGDVLCVFSQYGEVVNINLVRDKQTGKSQGYCFICYEDQRSTVLAVDNLNAIKLDGRTIRVDHVTEYRTPKGDEKGEDGKYMEKVETGCAPQIISPQLLQDEDDKVKLKAEKKKKKKEKKEKKEKKKNKNKKKSEDASCDESSADEIDNKEIRTHKSEPKFYKNKKTISESVSNYENYDNARGESKKSETRKYEVSQWDRKGSSPDLFRKKDGSPPQKRSRSSSDDGSAHQKQRERNRSKDSYSQR